MKSSYKRFIIAFVLGIVCIILAFVCRKNASPAFAWAFLLFGLGLTALCCAVRSQILSYIGIIFLTVFLALAAGEFYLSWFPPAGFAQMERPETSVLNLETSADGAYDRDPKARKIVRVVGEHSSPDKPDPVTGYRYKPFTKSRAEKTRDNNIIYDVIYSTEEDGWRVMPKHPAAKQAVVFFGCSFTFGEALNDDETYPWKTAQLLGPDYQVFNFSQPGYGPHQFLALLEAGILEPITAKYQQMHVFFLTLNAHTLRASGYASWDMYGPWYEIKNGRAVRQGMFADKFNEHSGLDKFFKKSNIYELLFKTPRQADEQGPMRELEETILATAAARVIAGPRSDFTLLTWPGTRPFGAIITDRDFPRIDLSQALPGYRDDDSPYIVPGDNHPNAQANDLVAAFLAGYIRNLP